MSGNCEANSLCYSDELKMLFYDTELNFCVVLEAGRFEFGILKLMLATFAQRWRGHCVVFNLI